MINMKTKRLLFVFIILAAVVGCERFMPFMFAPDISTKSLFSNEKRITFSWPAVKDATSYSWKLSNEDDWKTTTDTSVSVDAPESGVIKFQVKANVAGKKGAVLSSETSELSVIIDRIAPAEPILNVVSETCNPRPEWSWSDVDGADFFKYQLDDEKEVIVSNRTTFFKPEEDLSEGEHTLKLLAGDKAGNWSQLVSATCIINYNALSEPQWNMGGVDLLTKATKPTWRWISDPSAFRYRVQLNGEYEDQWEYVGISTEFAPSYALPDGVHTLYVQVQNYIGGEPGMWSSSAVLAFTIDNTPPSAPTLTGQTVTNSFRPTWQWDVPESTDKFELNYEGNELGLFDVDVTSYTVPEGTISESGSYNFSVRALDKLGNASDWVTFETKVDTAGGDKPEIMLVGAVKVDEVGDSTMNPKPTFEFSIPSGQEVKQFFYRIDNNPSDNDPTKWSKIAGSKRSLTLSSALSTGYHTIDMVAQNMLDNMSGVSTYRFMIDLDPPAAPVIVSLGIIGELRPTFTWNYNKDVFEYRYNLDNGPWLYTKENFWKVETDLVGEEGDGRAYTFVCQARDHVGNWGTPSSIVVKISTSVPDSPKITCLDGSRTKNATPTWQWSLPAGVTVTKLGYRLDTWENETVVTSAPFTLSYKVKMPLVTAGNEVTHKFYVRVWDDKNIASGYAVSEVVIDLKPPVAPTVSGTTPTGDVRPIWTWSHSALSDVAKFAFKVDSDSGSPDVDSDGWTVMSNTSVRNVSPSRDLNDGEHTMYVRVADALGNWSTSGSMKVKIDTTALEPPVVTIAVKDLHNNGNPISGTYYVNTKTPTFTWAHSEIGKQDGGKAVIQKYRFSTNNELSWKVVNGDSETSFLPQFALSDGKRSCSVQVLNQVGNWSKSGKIDFSVATEKPNSPYVTSAAPSNSDTTPTWVWSHDSGDAVEFRYRLKASDPWTVVPATQFKFVPSSPLEYGVYTFEVQAKNVIGLWSDSGKYSVDINASAVNYGIPKMISLKEVSKGAIKDGIRIEWNQDIEASYYEVYRVTQEEYNKNAKQGTLIATVKDKCVYYDKSSEAKSGDIFYYRVLGGNGDGVGAKSDLSSSGAELAKGSALALSSLPFGSLNNADGKLVVRWDSVLGATSYRIMKAPKQATAVSSPLSLPYKYYASDSLWKDYTGNEKDSDFFEISNTQFLDTEFDSVVDYYYYRIECLNQNSKNDARYISEGEVSQTYFKTGFSDAAALLLAPRDMKSWISATDNDTSSTAMYGKVKVTVTVPTAYRPYLHQLNFKLHRKYRYGDGYQGHNAVSKTQLSDSNLSTHTSLTNPNPASVPWDKDIALEYNFDGNSFTNGVNSCMDTLYDIDGSGTKLIAAINKSFKAVDPSIPAYPWYERTQQYMNSCGQTWEPIVDPDGSRSEFEFHYLIWDWIVRKAINNPGNPKASSESGNKRFDINEMTRCDYSLEVISNVAGRPDVNYHDKNYSYGWPALTPREFVFLGEFLREVTFYRIGVSWLDEYRQAGIGDAGAAAADQFESGVVGGKLSKTNGSGGTSGASANLVTSGGPHGGILEFPNCEMVLNWSPFNIVFGGSSQKCMDNAKFSIYTPRWQGDIFLTAYLYGGQIFHGLGSGSEIGVSYASFSGNKKLFNIMPNADQGRYWIIHEFICMGHTWHRITYSESNNANTYYDRYTSVHWNINGTIPAKNYPGFN